MLKTLLDGRYYSNEDVFYQEKKRIFESSWLFVGSQEQLKKDNQYFLVQLFDWSIIVGRYDGKICAFENHCPHRSAPIYSHESGRGALQCPYHGWSFASDGKIRSVPQQKELFDWSEEQKKCIGLNVFSVDTIGDLIFIQMPKYKKSLGEFLGSMKDFLTVYNSMWSLSQPWSGETVSANWKLLVEAALENYHTLWTHPNSLGMQIPPTMDYFQFSSYNRRHQVMNIGNHVKKELMTSATTVAYVFPNSFLIQLDGAVSATLSFLPQSFNKTTVRAQNFYHRNEPRSLASMNEQLQSLQQTNLEDKKICEQQQLQIHRHKAGRPLAKTEKAIYDFQKNYLYYFKRSYFNLPWN